MSYGHTYPELRTLVYDKAGVTSSHAQLTLSRVEALLWRAQLELVSASLSAGIIPINLRKTANLDLETTNPHYLPTDLMVLQQLRAKDGSGEWTTLRARTEERWDEEYPEWQDDDTDASGGPLVYVMQGVENTFGSNYGKQKVAILPVPATAVSGGLKVRYVRNPMPFSDFSGNSTNIIVDVPGEFHEALAHYAAWKFLSNNQSVPRQDYDKHYQVFDAATKRYVALQGETNQPAYEGSFGSALFGLCDNYWRSL